MKKLMLLLLVFVAVACNAQAELEAKELSYSILFGVTSLILMIISNILFYKDNNITFVFSFIATFATAIAAAFALAATFTAAAAFATIAALAVAFAVAAAFPSNKKSYKVASIMYYILITIYFILLFV